MLGSTGLARVLVHELDLVERRVDDLRPLEDLVRRSCRIGVGTSALVRRDLERVVGRVEPLQLRQLQLGLVRERRPLLRQLVSLGLHLRLLALTLQLRDFGVELIDQSASGVDLGLQQFLRPRLRIGRGRGIRLVRGDQEVDGPRASPKSVSIGSAFAAFLILTIGIPTFFLAWRLAAARGNPDGSSERWPGSGSLPAR